MHSISTTATQAESPQASSFETLNYYPSKSVVFQVTAGVGSSTAVFTIMSHFNPIYVVISYFFTTKFSSTLLSVHRGKAVPLQAWTGS
jgi:hypothetical protein